MITHDELQALALGLPEVTEEPHFERTSFRIRGKIIATAISSEPFVNIMVSDAVREPAVKLYAECVEPLFWGKKVCGLRVNLAEASMEIVGELLQQAWCGKAPKTLIKKFASDNP